MGPILDSFWRAAAYTLHPRVILWSLLPLLVAGGAVAALGWYYWEPTIGAVRQALEQWELVAALLQWLDSIGANELRTLMAPLIVVALAVPVVVLATLLLVAVAVTPAVVRMVAARRFPALERREGAGWWQGLAWALACTVAAAVAIAASIPLWFVPPLVMLLPPLIWGWLTYRIFAFDVLAVHASTPERRQIMQARRWPLLSIGLVCGYLGALPSFLWVASAATLIFAPVLVVISVWLYTLVFVFAACWFAHYALAELQRMRLAQQAAEIAAAVPEPLPPLPPPSLSPSASPPPPPQTLPPLQALPPPGTP